MAVEAIEHFGILQQITAQVYSLTRNVRQNAARYIVRANAGVNPVALGVEMKEDATAFKVRLQQLTDIASRNQAVVQAALAIIGMTLGEANTLKNALVASANHVLAATLTTQQQCIDEANAILASVPNYEGLF